MSLNRDKNRAVVGTIIVHALILMLMFYFGFSTPLPLPGEEGVEVRLGDPLAGGSSVKISTEKPVPPMKKIEPKPLPKPVQEEEIVEQNTEEAPDLNAEKPKEAVEEEVVKKIPDPEPEVETPEENQVDTALISQEIVEEVVDVPKEPVVNPAALYQGKKNDEKNGSGANGTIAGDKGKPEGSIDSDKEDGLGGKGNGVSFYLGGRGSVYLKEPPYKSKEQGRVVVEVIVNQQGIVTRATAGKKIPDTEIGTTVTDQNLWKLASEAASKSTFTPDPSAPEGQKGYIIYNFIRLN